MQHKIQYVGMALIMWHVFKEFNPTAFSNKIISIDHFKIQKTL